MHGSGNSDRSITSIIDLEGKHMQEGYPKSKPLRCLCLSEQNLFVLGQSYIAKCYAHETHVEDIIYLAIACSLGLALPINVQSK